MTENQNTDAGEQYPEESAAQELDAQKRVKGGLYRMREIIAGLIALTEDGSISAGQVKQALQKAFKRQFP